MSAVTLNSKLNELKVQYYTSGTWVLYSKHDGKGYTQTKTYTFTDNNGNSKTSIQTTWTEKGREFIHSLFKE